MNNNNFSFKFLAPSSIELHSCGIEINKTAQSSVLSEDAFNALCKLVCESYIKQQKEEQSRLQMEGIRQAKNKGTRLGRPEKKKTRSFTSVFNLWKNGDLSARQAAKMLEVSPGTFIKWAEEAKK